MLKYVQFMLQYVKIGVLKIFVCSACWEPYRGKSFVKTESN